MRTRYPWAHLTFALRRPRTSMSRKPRLGNYLFLELNKTKGIDLKQGDLLEETKETLHVINERLMAFGKCIKDKARSKPYMSNQIPKNERNVTSRFLDDANKGSYLSQDDNTIVSKVHHYARKYNDMEHLPRTKFGLNKHSKPIPKLAKTKKVSKRNQSGHVDVATHGTKEGSPLSSKIGKKKGYHVTQGLSIESSCKQRGHDHEQESSDYYDTYLTGESSPESEQAAHNNHVLATPGAAPHVNGRGGMQVPTVRKSSRVPKKRMFDDDDEEPIKRPRKRPEAECNDVYGEDNEVMDLVVDENGHLEKEWYERNGLSEPEKDPSLTSQQRTLRLSKEGGDLQNGMNVDFPDELQPAFSRKQKESVSETEQTIKREEAARRRKQQMDRKAAQIQASAIQKILGQESARKKREEKLKKQREEVEQEKQAALMVPAVNSIRWVMGPSGNVVSFSQDVELPKIFCGPCSYPREREKCAGPSCNNAYRYRDAKTRLPLCSLLCYRAIQELPRAVF